MIKNLSVLCFILINFVQASKFGNENETIIIGFLASYGETRVVLGALPLAIEEVNKNSKLLLGRKLTFKAADIERSSSQFRTHTIKIMTEMREQNISVFIGPDESCANEALVAASWNMPMISYRCADSNVSNKNIFKTFARTFAPVSKVSKSVISLLDAFNWRKFSIITAIGPEWGLEVAQAIRSLGLKENFTVMNFREISDHIPTRKTLRHMEKVVEETFRTTRSEHFAMIDFVRCLQNKKLLSTGEYVVVSVDDENYDPSRRSNILEREYLDPFIEEFQHNELNEESFESVIKIGTLQPMNPHLRDVGERIKELSRLPPFLVPYNEKVFNQILIPSYGADLYDAVIIYARAAGEVLHANGDIKNGSLLMSRIYNRSYQSIRGFNMHIDASGDAEGNYTVIALQNDGTGKPSNETKLIMKPIGYFIHNSDTSLPEFRYLSSTDSFRWRHGKPPKAEPICGFYGELCQLKNWDWRYIISGSFIALFLIVAGAFLIKHYRYEQTLAGLLWKIEMKDVNVIYMADDDVDARCRSFRTMQACRHNFPVGIDGLNRPHTNIGIYKGNVVAVKKIYKRSVDITRAIRKEFKQMREIRHENIITFIGASIDNGAIAIFTLYCSRGSLEHVLANDDLHLDQMFISSLVSDILKGMIFLHDSDIISHGNLRSSNCLIDSRWVCQISDFGLHEFKAGQDEPNKYKFELKRSLWRAPEILRSPTPLSRGTQKGDIYSLGIVLYEIVGCRGPWGRGNYTEEEIIELVKYPSFMTQSYFRPPTEDLDVPDYIKKCLDSCWEENPDLRPDIQQVQQKLKPMQAGLKPNIFDNMLAIMEKYAYNLEGLVQERTNLLYEEKKKTEALLLRMLPRSVAESLKRGEKVQAECFDCVTIFFSDLVGFTELCAKSTPFEVVDMLNDLYTCCDSIISNYDAYKVETIGDAYMVVSGLPIRNGDKHAGEIASLSLELLSRVSKLEIRHRPGEFLQFRIGIHSGQCVAGVVGLKMPRYCLFGDTVNTASRMESTGEPLRIHVSVNTYEMLEKLGSFLCQERGWTSIKGKGHMKTYWLLGQKESHPQYFGQIYETKLDATPDLINNTDMEIGIGVQKYQTKWFCNQCNPAGKT